MLPSGPLLGLYGGYLQTPDQKDKTADYTLVAADAGILFTNAGAAGAVTFTLPAIKPNMRYVIRKVAAQTLTITRAGSDTILTRGNASATSFVLDQIGDAVAIESNESGDKWYVTDIGALAPVGGAGASYSVAPGAPIAEVIKTTDYTVVAADNGKLFTNEGAAGAVNFTLPTVAAGYRFWFKSVADQNLTVTGAAGTVIALNNAAATSVAFSTASQKIGGGFMVESNAAGTKWRVQTFSAGANTVTVA